jgi:hypothetical protein
MVKPKCMRKRRCLFHPAMDCPTPNEPCIFILIDEMIRKGESRIDESFKGYEKHAESHL